MNPNIERHPGLPGAQKLENAASARHASQRPPNLPAAKSDIVIDVSKLRENAGKEAPARSGQPGNGVKRP
jgi:hypothetical protein